MKLFNMFKAEAGSSFWVGPIMGCLTLLVFCAYSHAEADDSTSVGRTQTISEIYEETLASRQGDYRMFVDKVIATLEEESLDESLKGLEEHHLYLFPGLGVAGGQARPDMFREIVANRRFLKVFGELSMMPKDEAAAVLNREIQATLKQYNNAFYGFVGSLDSELRLTHHRKPFVFGFSSRGQGPTLTILQYKMLALTLLAGNLELDLADSGVNLVLEAALEQKELFQDRELFTAAIGMLLENISLYDPAFLGLALVQGSGKTDTEIQSTLNSLNLRMATLEMVPYDAEVTPMDQAMDPLRAVDYSKGKFEIKYFPMNSIDTSKFNSLKAAVRATGD